MSGIIINVRGSNASGKTTTVREFIKSYGDDTAIEQVAGNIVTRCGSDAYVLGRYDRKNGGCDGYSGREQVLAAIRAIIKEKRPRIIVYEGMIYSKTVKMARDISQMFIGQGYRYKGVYLRCSFAEVIRRLEARNEGKAYDILSVKKTYDACYSTYKSIKAEGLDITRIDTDAMSLDEMGGIILHATRESKP